MVKRKRIPLQLKGTDEQYFRTKEIVGKPDEPLEQPVMESSTEIVNAAASEAKVTPTPQKPDKGVAEPKVPTPQVTPRKKKPTQPTPATEEKAEIVSRIIHLGVPLSKRLQATAEKFGVPVDDLLYAARKKTVTHFRQKISASKKPEVPEFEKGGETLRVAVSLSAEELVKLKGWYDPLDIGLATKVVSPLMTAAFRAEVKTICDAAGS